MTCRSIHYKGYIETYDSVMDHHTIAMSGHGSAVPGCVFGCVPALGAFRIFVESIATGYPRNSDNHKLTENANSV